MDDAQLPVEAPAHRQLSNDSDIQTAESLDAARPAQGRQEHQRGDMCQAGQGRVPLSPTEEYRMRAATFLERPQWRPESDGNAMEIQMHSKVIANFFVLIILLDVHVLRHKISSRV